MHSIPLADTTNVLLVKTSGSSQAMGGNLVKIEKKVQIQVVNVFGI